MKYIKNPILITGVYRSGTTIISRILNAHPSIDCTYDSVSYFRYIVKKNIPAEKYREIIKSITSRLKERYQIKLDPLIIIETIEKKGKAITHKDIYSTIMQTYFGNTGRRWGEKTLLEWTNIPTFLSMYPEGQVIHIIRDPRDVLSSFKNMTIEPGKNYLDAVFCMMHSMNSALRYRSLFPEKRYYILIYEDFISDQHAVINNLCDFLGETFDKRLLDPKHHTDRHGGKLFSFDTHTAYSEETKRNKRTLSGKWREKLTDFEKIYVEALLMKQMTKFGYDLSDGIDTNPLVQLIEMILEEPLLAKRWINFLKTKDGIESYPSDPTDPKNWVTETGVIGQGVAAAFKRRSPKS